MTNYLRYRRAGQQEASAPPVGRPPIEISDRRFDDPGRLAGIRGIDQLAHDRAHDRRQEDTFWREVWADEIAARGARCRR